MSAQSLMPRIIRAGLRRTLQLSWQSGYLYERDLLDCPIPDLKPRVQVVMVNGDASHLALACNIFPRAWIDQAEQRLAKGAIWALALAGDAIAYSSWVGFSDEKETGLQIVVPVGENEAYIFNSFTTLEFRGKGLHTVMTAYQLQVAKDARAKRVLGIIHLDNVPAMHVWAKLDFQAKKRITRITFWRKSFHIYRSVRS